MRSLLVVCLMALALPAAAAELPRLDGGGISRRTGRSIPTGAWVAKLDVPPEGVPSPPLDRAALDQLLDEVRPPK